VVEPFTEPQQEALAAALGVALEAAFRYAPDRERQVAAALAVVTLVLEGRTEFAKSTCNTYRGMSRV
jgi:hypothetical protein